MGFRPEETHYRLKFEESALAGLEVMARALTVSEFERISQLSSEVAASSADGNLGNAANEAATNMLDRFAAAVVSWNIEDSAGNVLPTTRTGLGQLEFPFVMRIIRAWMTAIAGVDENLENASNNGGTSLEQSIPMVMS